MYPIAEFLGWPTSLLTRDVGIPSLNMEFFQVKEQKESWITLEKINNIPINGRRPLCQPAAQLSKNIAEMSHNAYYCADQVWRRVQLHRFSIGSVNKYFSLNNVITAAQNLLGDQSASIIAEGNIHSHLFVLINIALMMCPSILLSISCTRKKQAKLEHTKHKKERKGSKENDGTEERRKNISKTNTEQLPTTTEEKKDSVEMGGLRIARQDRKRDEDHKIELNEPRRKTNRRTKPQDKKRAKTKTKPLKTKDYDSGNVKRIRSKVNAAQIDTLSHDIHSKHKKRRDEDDRMERNTRNSQEAAKISMFEDAEKQEKHKRRESSGKRRSVRKKQYAPYASESKDDFNRGGSASAPEHRKYCKGEQIQREPRLPTGRLRDGETRSTPNEIDRKVQPRRFAMGEKEMQIARGSRAGRHEYKTMDDVLSDWGSDRSMHAKQSILGRGQPKIRQANVGQYKLEMKRPGRSASHHKRSNATAKLRSSKQPNNKEGKQSKRDGIEQWNSLGDNMVTNMLHSMSTQSESEMRKLGSG
uniref:Uncharacterized protein n=1 Tax=Ascaris lumbricoides TaxID=6252 RepID=A0A9J2Q3K7_ASCLU